MARCTPRVPAVAGLGLLVLAATAGCRPGYGPTRPAERDPLYDPDHREKDPEPYETEAVEPPVYDDEGPYEEDGRFDASGYDEPPGSRNDATGERGPE